MSFNKDLDFYQNQILFGRDESSHIVAIEMEADERVRLFRKRDGKLTSEIEPFNGFILLKEKELLSSFKEDYKVEELEGEGFFKLLVIFDSLSRLEKAKKYLQKKIGKSPTHGGSPYFYLTDPINQFMLLKGKTEFLGMKFADLLRCQVDIETYCAKGFEFSNPHRDSDRIIAISVTDSEGFEKVIKGNDRSEAEMLEELVQTIAQRDPDVIEGHNIFRFDLEYIETRAKRLGIKLGLGRGGKELKGHPSRMQIAERAITYRKYEIYGRHIVDTWILAQHYDVQTRELESFGLKEIARHFGLSSKDRTYIPHEEIAHYFDRDPARLFSYCLDDARETGKLSQLLSPSFFIEAQIFPFSYQNIILKGNATKINSLFLREYLYQRYTVPRPDSPIEVQGGYTDIRFQGVKKDIVHCDITSLYPSIILTYNLFPKKDKLGIFPLLLRDLKDFRVRAKEREAKAQNLEERSYFDALQSAFKILINSFYGYLGTYIAHFNDFEKANEITKEGRSIIKGKYSGRHRGAKAQRHKEK